ncbi:MAG: hypothetical protein KatS3mg132_691 [Limisphaera sp.]|nr:MAG: hypothetical protein KatS3mg132_691 [Limisphaera sp.]
MKRYLLTSLAACALGTWMASTAQALNVDLYVDSAPNVYGSPNWAPWWTATKADVVAGTFQNLRSATYPGTLRIDPYDEIVYSTGDLGRRLHWIYWVPGETTASLDGRFEVKWVIDWDGVNYTYDWSTYSWALDDPDTGWIQPSRWENYSGGVIGSLGFAWWATDDDAPPYDTGGSPYDETDQADIDALRAQVFQYQTFAAGFVRHRDDVNSPWQVISLRVTLPDSGSTLSLLALAAAGLAPLARRVRL